MSWQQDDPKDRYEVLVVTIPSFFMAIVGPLLAMYGLDGAETKKTW